MKRLFPIALSLLLCHCGTEVGNGIAPSEDTGGAKTGSTTGTPTSAPEIDDAAGENTSTINYVLSTSFIAACASPFAESIEGTFVNSQSQAGFKVTIGNDSKRTVSRTDGSVIFVVTPAPSVSTYAIEALPMAPNVTCSAVTSQTLGDGTVQRSVTLSSGTVVSWTLNGGKVISMKLTTSSMAEEAWNQSNQ